MRQIKVFRVRSGFNGAPTDAIVLIPMCLAVPMQVTAVDGLNATCAARGVERQVSLLLLQVADGEQAVAPGDFVTVHMGQAVAKVSADEARVAWELLDRILDES